MNIVACFSRLDLKRLILSLTLVSVLVTLGNSYFSIYQVQRSLLINSHLDASRVYASKIANTTDYFFNSVMESMSYSARILGSEIDNEAIVEQEANRLVNQMNTFDFIVISDMDGKVIHAYPDTLNVENMMLPSDIRKTFESKKPFISDPFYTALKQPFINIAYPIFSLDDRYIGYISGIIFLRLDSALYNLLGHHSYNNNTSYHVIDKNNTIIHHVDAKKIGTKLSHNLAVSSHHSGVGSERIQMQGGFDVLMGYSSVESANWVVVGSRPTVDILSPLNEQVFQVFLKGLPLTLITLLFIWFSAIHIARPLRLLAKNTVMGKDDYAEKHKNIFEIRSWYVEAQQLKKAMLTGMEAAFLRITELDADTQTDPLTGILNRRGMNKCLNLYEENKQEFSVVALDIDHFKRVNDTFGHAEGDQVIKGVSALMQDKGRANDVLCRVGGEEFLIFLPDTNLNNAIKMAERLRKRVEETLFPSVGNITISLGVTLAKWQDEKLLSDVSIAEADKALYQAKQQGRNAVVVYEE